MIVGKTGVASQVEVQMNDEIMDVYSSFRRLSSSFSEDRGPQEDVKRVDEELIFFGASKKLCNGERASLDVQIEFYERIVTPKL